MHVSNQDVGDKFAVQDVTLSDLFHTRSQYTQDPCSVMRCFPYKGLERDKTPSFNPVFLLNITMYLAEKKRRQNNVYLESYFFRFSFCVSTGKKTYFFKWYRCIRITQTLLVRAPRDCDRTMLPYV